MRKCSASIKRLIAALAPAVLFVIIAAQAGYANADSRWTNYMDASLIRGMVERNGELYMATNGGLLIYSPDTGEFEQYDNTDGLPSNNLTCLMFDDRGDLWIGTVDVGVARVTMDPGKLNVRTFNPLEFPDQHFTSVDMWGADLVYGTRDGAGRFEEGLPGPMFFTRDGLPSDTVNAVMADGDVVWFATDRGVAVLDRLGFILPVNGSPPVGRALARADGYVWIGTDDGVWRMATSDSSWTEIGPPGPAFDPELSVYSLHWDGQKMWAGGTYAFFDYDEPGGFWREYSLWSFFGKYEMAAATGEMRALASLPGGDIYAGGTAQSSQRGFNLARFDGSTRTNIVPNTPGENRIDRVTLDIDGSTWVSCEGFGVGKLMPSGQWVNYNKLHALSDSLSNLFRNLTMLVDLDGHKWFSTLSWNENEPRPLDELIDNFDNDYANDRWIRHPLGSGGGDGYSTLRPQRALLDPVGNRWFLADEDPDNDFTPMEWRGIHILRRDRSTDEWLHVSPDTEPRMMGGNITHVAHAGNGLVFVAILGYGVQSWDTGGLYDWESLSDLTNDDWGGVLNARVGVRGELYAASQVFSLALRSDDVLWIGTDAGVYKFNPRDAFNTFKLIAGRTGSEVGLLTQTVNYVLLDHQENLWVATPLGLNRISRDNDNDIEAYTTTATWQWLNEIPILYPQSVISPLAGAECRDLYMHPEEDLLYIATGGGLSVFDISEPAEQPTDLTRVYLYPNPVDGSRGHENVKIDNVDGAVAIDIYNQEGNLVHSQSAAESGEVIWDLTTQSGFIVATGVYYVRINNGIDTVVLPITVIR
jgi:ligand-binding sensor domain-containing protein